MVGYKYHMTLKISSTYTEILSCFHFHIMYWIHFKILLLNTALSYDFLHNRTYIIKHFCYSFFKIFRYHKILRAKLSKECATNH